MAHILHTEEPTYNKSPEWLMIGRAVADLANDWALRRDLIAYVGENAGGQAPACYKPLRAEIEVNSEIAFGKGVTPEMIGDLTKRSTQFEFPRAIGAVMHEAFHARFSNWDLQKANAELTPMEFKALNLLEEGRIEAQGLRAMPESKNFLRACAMDIVLDDAEETFKEGTNTQGAVTLVALVHARIDAGVFEEDEALEVKVLVDEFLGAEVVEKLRNIARRAQAHAQHSNAEPLYDLAREWVKVLQDVAEEKGDADNSSEGESGEGEGEGSGKGMPPEFAEALKDALAEMGAIVSIRNGDALGEQQTSEEWAEEVKVKNVEAKERGKNEQIAADIFAKSTMEAGSRSSSILLETRKPSSQEHIAAVTVSTMLEKAKYRERDEVEIASAVPPGRLRTRAMVQANAQRARGVYAQVEPWRRTVRRSTENPSLTVGVMVDISGSMGSAMQPMATTAWVMSEAVKRVQGKCAMVYYGNDVFPTLKAGQSLPEVRVFSAVDSTEKFDKAFRALDGALELLNGEGARLLVVVSDGQYTPDEKEKAKQWMRRCAEAGVGVLWLPFDGGHSAKRYTNFPNVSMLTGHLDPTATAQEIGRVAAEALTNAGRGR